MDKKQWATLARLCALLDGKGISALPKSNRDPEFKSAWLHLKGVNQADTGTYQIRIIDLDTDLEALLNRDPDWYWQILQTGRVYGGNERLARYLPDIWFYNDEMVTIKIGEVKFYLLVADIVLP